MDRFCFGVITGLAFAAVVGDGWPTWKLVVVIVPLYLIARHFACRLSKG